jgi:hypothetical protein
MEVLEASRFGCASETASASQPRHPQTLLVRFTDSQHITCNGDIPKTRINHSLTKGPDVPASMKACLGVSMYSRHPSGGTSRDEKGDWLHEAIIYNASQHVGGLSEAAEGRAAKVHPSIAQTTLL